MYLDDGFADESGSKEGLKWNTEVTTGDAGEVEERIGDGGTCQNSSKSVFFHVVVYDYLGLFHKGLFVFSFQLQNLLNLFI